jgi:hypothetical protein
MVYGKYFSVFTMYQKGGRFMQWKQWLGFGLLLGIFSGSAMPVEAQAPVGYQPLGSSLNSNPSLTVSPMKPNFTFNAFTPTLLSNHRRPSLNPAAPNQALHQSLPQGQLPQPAQTGVVPGYMTHLQYFHPVNIQPQALPQSRLGQR